MNTGNEVVPVSKEALAQLARAYEEQRRPGYNHPMTQALGDAIEAVLGGELS